MKINLLMLLLIVCLCFSCKSKSQTQINESYVINSWTICVRQINGLEEHPNHCPEIIFLKDGNGILEASDPATKFQWKIVKNTIYFSFKSVYDEKNFISKNKELQYEFYTNDNLQFLKLIDSTTGNWFMLSSSMSN